MDFIKLGNNDIPQGYEVYVPHVPGWLAPSFEFIIKEEKESYYAHVIYPFGRNAKKIDPIIAWITSEDGKYYNPECFFKKHLGEIWKYEEQDKRFFSLWDKYKTKQNVILFRQIPAEKFDQVPMACFVKDEHDMGPYTHINKESIYGKYIYYISTGKLKEVVDILLEHPKEIALAYPYLNYVNENILTVSMDEKALNWIDEQKSVKIDDIMAQKEFFSTFEELNDFFIRLFEKKIKLEEEKFRKGILGIIAKVFAYIPRQ